MAQRRKQEEVAKRCGGPGKPAFWESDCGTYSVRCKADRHTRLAFLIGPKIDGKSGQICQVGSNHFAGDDDEAQRFMVTIGKAVARGDIPNEKEKLYGMRDQMLMSHLATEEGGSANVEGPSSAKTGDSDKADRAGSQPAHSDAAPKRALKRPATSSQGAPESPRGACELAAATLLEEVPVTPIPLSKKNVVCLTRLRHQRHHPSRSRATIASTGSS